RQAPQMRFHGSNANWGRRASMEWCGRRGRREMRQTNWSTPWKGEPTRLHGCTTWGLELDAPDGADRAFPLRQVKVQAMQDESALAAERPQQLDDLLRVPPGFARPGVVASAVQFLAALDV